MKRLLIAVFLVLLYPQAYGSDTDVISGKVILLDPHANTITIQTQTGLKEFEVDSADIVIEESGPLVGYEQEPSLKSLQLGDFVTVIEDTEGETPARRKLKRIRRSHQGQ